MSSSRSDAAAVVVLEPVWNGRPTKQTKEGDNKREGRGNAMKKRSAATAAATAPDVPG